MSTGICHLHKALVPVCSRGFAQWAVSWQGIPGRAAQDLYKSLDALASSRVATLYV